MSPPPRSARSSTRWPEGLKAGDGGSHLITFHPRGPGQSSLQAAGRARGWISTCHRPRTARATTTPVSSPSATWRSTPLRPTLDGEPRYEAMPVGFYLRDHDRLDRFDDDDVRQAAWWSVHGRRVRPHLREQQHLADVAGGAHAGALRVHSRGTRRSTIREHMQMGYLRKFMEAHAFQTLLPDQRIVANGPAGGRRKGSSGARGRRRVGPRLFAPGCELHAR